MPEGMWNAPDVVPSITYSDVPRAVEWLQRVFGFRERAHARLSWPGGGMAWLEIGNGLVDIGTPDANWPHAEGHGFYLKVYVDDVDAHFRRAQAEGATIVAEPQDGFWGGRTYRALDHEGHQWEISAAGRDLAAERWELPPGVRRGGEEEG
jgi:uncharacterized glyoxalase superfamily protein PhnB